MKYIIQVGDKFVRARGTPRLVTKAEATIFQDRKLLFENEPPVVGLEAAQRCLKGIALRGAKIVEA